MTMLNHEPAATVTQMTPRLLDKKNVGEESTQDTRTHGLYNIVYRHPPDKGSSIKLRSGEPVIRERTLILPGMILLSIISGFLINRPFPLEPTTLQRVFASWTVGTALLLLSGLVSLIFYRSLAPPLLLIVPFIIMSVKGGLMTPSALSIYVYLAIVLGITIYLGLKSGEGRNILKPNKKMLFESLQNERCMFLSMGLSFVALGLLGFFLARYILIFYYSFKLWVTTSLVTSIILALVCNKKTLILSPLAPISPAVLSALFLPEYTVHTHGGIEALYKKGVTIGIGTHMLSLPKEKGRKPEWKEIKPETLKLDPWVQRNPHILILGDSGSGKSFLAKIIAEEKARIGENVVIMDMHGEYGELVEIGYARANPYALELNPLDLDGESPSTRAMEFSYMVSELFNLGALQRALLIDVLREAYALKGIYDEDPKTWEKSPPSLRDVIGLITERSKMERRGDEKARLEALRRYLELLNIHEESRMNIEDMAEGNVILELNKAPNPVFQQIETFVILRKLFLYKQKKKGRLTIILDEAHRITGKQKLRESLESLVAEARKFDISFIIITQSPKSLSSGIFANTATKIVFRISEASSLEQVARNLTPIHNRLVIDTIKDKIKTLPPRHAVLYSDQTNTLIILETPHYYRL